MIAEEIQLLVIFVAVFGIIVVLISAVGDRLATPSDTKLSKKDVDPDEDHASDQGC